MLGAKVDDMARLWAPRFCLEGDQALRVGRILPVAMAPIQSVEAEPSDTPEDVELILKLKGNSGLIIGGQGSGTTSDAEVEGDAEERIDGPCRHPVALQPGSTTLTGVVEEHWYLP